MRKLPKIPTGDAAIVNHIRELHKCIRERTPLRNALFDIDFNECGWVPKGQPAPVASGSSFSIKCVTNLSILGGDYATGIGVDDGIGYIYALPWPLRQSNSNGVIGRNPDSGMEMSAQYISAGQRRVTGDIGGVPVTEIQRITPSYGLFGDVLIIAKVGNAALGGMRTNTQFGDADVAIEWADMNVAARAWAAVAVISGA